MSVAMRAQQRLRECDHVDDSVLLFLARLLAPPAARNRVPSWRGTTWRCDDSGDHCGGRYQNGCRCRSCMGYAASKFDYPRSEGR